MILPGALDRGREGRALVLVGELSKGLGAPVEGQPDIALFPLLVFGDTELTGALRVLGVLFVEQKNHVRVLLNLPGLPQGGHGGGLFPALYLLRPVELGEGKHRDTGGLGHLVQGDAGIGDDVIPVPAAALNELEVVDKNRLIPAAEGKGPDIRRRHAGGVHELQRRRGELWGGAAQGLIVLLLQLAALDFGEIQAHGVGDEPVMELPLPGLQGEEPHPLPGLRQVPGEHEGQRRLARRGIAPQDHQISPLHVEPPVELGQGPGKILVLFPVALVEVQKGLLHGDEAHPAALHQLPGGLVQDSSGVLQVHRPGQLQAQRAQAGQPGFLPHGLYVLPHMGGGGGELHHLEQKRVPLGPSPQLLADRHRVDGLPGLEEGPDGLIHRAAHVAEEIPVRQAEQDLPREAGLQQQGADHRHLG